MPGQDPGERGVGVHLGVRREPQLYELIRLQEMSLAEHYDAAVPFCGLGGQQVGFLGHQLGFQVAWLGAQRPDDRDIQARVPNAGLEM